MHAATCKSWSSSLYKNMYANSTNFVHLFRRSPVGSVEAKE
jgi:hypothetical protein